MGKLAELWQFTGRLEKNTQDWSVGMTMRTDWCGEGRDNDRGD
jgi:hypothetical protein